jgi:hypothetical protein
MKTTIILVLSVLILMSCGMANVTREANLWGENTPGIKQEQIGKFTIHELFTLKGVTIYRFIDGGHARYFGIDGNKTVINVKAMESSGGKTPTYSLNEVIEIKR